MHLLATGKYTDVTDQFKRDAAKLKPNEISGVAGFTLPDAISAFELGNPKMDTGLDFVTYKQSLEEMDYPSGLDQILAAMDALFCLEMSWLKGATLIQTVFSAIFVESELQGLANPEISHPSYLDQVDPASQFLRVYVLATLRSCGVAISQVIEGSMVISLEEEFHHFSSNWSLLEDVPMSQVLSLLDKSISHCKSKPELAAIGMRLQLRFDILKSLEHGVTNDYSSIDSALQIISRIVPAEPNTSWFGKGVQTRSDGVCLPQSLIRLEFVDAKAYFTSLFENIKHLSASLLPIQKSADLLGFFLNFAKEDHTPLLRAIIKNTFNRQTVLGHSAVSWAQKDITELSYPALPETKATVSKECKQEWDAFIFQAKICYTELLTCLCFGRTRQRQIMFESVAAWDSVHVAAQALDKAIISAGLSNTLSSTSYKWAFEFSSWVYHRKLQLMLWSFLMGFEQSLFSPFESSSMYWYAKNLSAVLVEQLSRLKLYFQEHNYRQSPGYHYLVAMEVEARCLEHLCTANWLVFLILERRGLVSGPKSSYSTPELVYGLRLECFEAIGIPQLPTYNAYTKESQIYDDDLALGTIKQNLSGVQAFLKAISQAAGANPEIQRLKRSAFGLSALVLKLSKNSVEKIEIIREGNHPYFPVPTSV